MTVYSSRSHVPDIYVHTPKHRRELTFWEKFTDMFRLRMPWQPR